MTTANPHPYAGPGRLADAWRLLRDHEAAVAALEEGDIPLPPGPDEAHASPQGLAAALADGWEILLAAGYSHHTAGDALRTYYPEAEPRDLARAYYLASPSKGARRHD